MREIISAKNISKIFNQGKRNEVSAIKNIDFDIYEGDFIVIMGQSGSGKSTLLNCISTLDTPTKGKVYIDNVYINTLSERSINEFRYKRLGYVFQNYNLMEELNNYHNISLPLYMHKEKKDEIRKKIDKLSKQLEIEDIINKYPTECSGGEKQRVAIARALVTSPRIIFADEPTGNLDSKNTKNIINSLKQFNDQGITIVLVTHDCYVASFGKRVIFMSDGNIVNCIESNGMNQKEFFDRLSQYSTKL